ncbi:hypothetical protein GS534_24465 [Rhodococcus hoagii]|nr:hypothetical protein [Prescottella equi]NKS33184.1 hypothetical protein [Prescottella equi]
MSKRSKHQKAEFPAGGYSSGVAERLTPPPESAQSKPAVAIPVSDEARERGLAGLGYEPHAYVWHDNELGNGNSALGNAMHLAAERFDQGLPPYSPVDYKPLTPDEMNILQIGELTADVNYLKHEHGLAVRRISNQRRELRNLNRAYRRRENENARRTAMLKDQLKISIRATTLRNQKIETQQAEIDELRRQLNVAQNGGRRKRGVRWPRS